MATLYINNKPILNSKHWEDLVEFIEELIKLIPMFVDCRNFIVKSCDQVMFSWNRKLTEVNIYG